MSELTIAPLSMAPPRKNRLSQTELARMARVSTKTLRDWRDSEGLNLDDLQAVMRRAGKVDRMDDDSRGESYAEARRRRAVADANKAEILARREAGQLVELAEVQATFAALGAELKARLLALRGDLVHELEGQPGPAIHRILDKRICELLERIHSNVNE